LAELKAHLFKIKKTYQDGRSAAFGVDEGGGVAVSVVLGPLEFKIEKNG
jgi:hypothetical protein